jgi:hypothetical protein
MFWKVFPEKRLFMLQIKSLCHPLALATVATCSLSGVASAATFNLSYTSSAGTITATIDGTLQPDNNTVIVSSVSNPTFNGSPAPALPFVGSYLDSIISIISGGTLTGQAVLSLNGLVLDFIACTDINCADGFGFLPPNTLINNLDTLFAAGGAYGGDGFFEPFVLANYSLTPADTPAVPEPAAVLGLLSIAGVGYLSKRQKQKK